MNASFDYPFYEDWDLPDHETTLAHLITLPGVTVVEAEGSPGQADYKFRFRGHFFWVMYNSHGGGTYFFVEDESCDPAIRDAVVDHFKPLVAIAGEQESRRSAWSSALTWVMIGCLPAVGVSSMVFAITIASCSR